MNLNIEQTNELDYGLLELSNEINELVISMLDSKYYAI